MKKTKSRFLRLNLKDILRALGIALGSSAVYLFTIMSSGVFPDLDILKSTAAVFIGSSGSYIIKNLFTNSYDKFLTPERKEEAWSYKP
jgi:hypothetical protein